MYVVTLFKSVISFLDGTTLHSGLGYTFGEKQEDLSKEKLDFLRKELEDVELVINDEMSMISSDHFYELHRRLMKIFESKDDFGGRALFMVGDLLQMPPVKGKMIFTEPKAYKSKVLKEMKDENEMPVMDLWEKLDTVVLKTNFRQGEGNPWTEQLNRIRVGQQTPQDIEELQCRVINPGEYKLLTKSEYEDAIHLFFTNLEVKNHNDYKLNTLDSDLIVIDAICDVPSGSGYKPQINEWGLIDQTNFSMHLELKVGARVMIVWNVNIADKLVNGTFGTVIDILFKDTGEVETIIVAVDNPEAGLEQRKEFKSISEKYTDPKGCPIFKTSMEYNIGLKRRGARNGTQNHGAKVKVTQYPLRLAWGCTGHKVQGVSIKKGTDVVAHFHKRLPPGLGYTMMSRAEAKDNLFLENFDPKKLRPNPEALLEDEKLQERSIVPSYENMSFSFFILNIRSLSKHFVDLKNDMFAQKSDHICVVETWIEPDAFDISNLFQLPEKAFDHASVARGKGCGIFSPVSKFNKNSNTKVIQQEYQLLSVVDGDIQLIIVYLSDKSPKKEVAEVMQNMIRPDMITIIAGDFNFDRSEKNELSKFLDTIKLDNLVTQPTHDGGRIIDHFYVPKYLKDRFTLTFHSPYYSDHDALCVKFERGNKP